MALDPKDGGYASRKLWFSLAAQGLIVGAGLVAAKYAGLAPIYDTMVGGVVAVAGLYLTGNIAAKWVTSKAPKPVESAQEE